MKILMLGWELPPHNSGGLGIACMGLTKALASKGADITFVLPHKVDVNTSHMKVVFANIKEDWEKLKDIYLASSALKNKYSELGKLPLDYVKAASLYAERIVDIAKKTNADLIHAHDWLTFPAGIMAKEVTGKPLIVHVHSTEFDRTGGNYPNPWVYKLEKEGIDKADKVISISNKQKDILQTHYEATLGKIEIIHNGIEETRNERLPLTLMPLKKLGYKIVLFLGRITLQKGPEYFVRAAKKVLEYNEKTVFVVVGSGDMQEQMMGEAITQGVMDKMIFTGFLRGEEKHRVWQSADVYIMPSVSEPFGLTALESVANGTPVILSKQSGVSEVLSHTLKVDFWDVDEIANKTLAALKYSELCDDLIEGSSREIHNNTWEKSAVKCMQVYNQIL